MDRERYEKEVYELVSSLMKKLGVIYSIDCLLEWYRSTDKNQAKLYSAIEEDILSYVSKVGSL